MSVDARRLREIFLEAVERPAAARGAYLDRVCGDDGDLRAELESLLAHHDDRPLIEDDASEPIRALAGSAPTVAHGEVSARRAESGSPDHGARYRTLGKLGAGGFGVVVRRFDRGLRRVVACKAPRVAETAQEAALLREARLLAYLDHPGVVQVYDLHEDASGVSYTMELLEGESLSQRLAELRAEGRVMAVSEALRIATRLCETVANAHAKGVLHLDLKPDNVMLEPFGHVSLIDWGMARFYDPEPYRKHLARAGEAEIDDLQGGELSGGTPPYMPPEQFDRDAALGPAADVYGLGALLFELLTGRPPFEVAGDAAALQKAKQHGAPPVQALRPELSERLGSLCARMLAPAPDARHGSVGEVLAALAALSDVGEGTELLSLDAGEVLFEQGDESTTAFQIVSGELEIVVDGAGVTTRGAGDIVGELAMLSRQPRSATVRATIGAVVRAIDWAALEGELSRVDPLVGRLLRSLSDKLIETTRG